MKKLCLCLVVSLFFAISSCNQKSGTQNTPATQVTNDKGVNIKLSELASNKDLNCDMPLAEGSIADTASYQGKIYGFCSPECKVEFLKDPQSHLVQK